MPDALPRLALGAGLATEALADVLAATVAASDEPASGAGGTSGGSPASAPASVDNAILERALGVLGGEPTIAQATAALTVLAQVADPPDDLKAGLPTPPHLKPT